MLVSLQGESISYRVSCNVAGTRGTLVVYRIGYYQVRHTVTDSIHSRVHSAGLKAAYLNDATHRVNAERQIRTRGTAIPACEQLKHQLAAGRRTLLRRA